MSGSKFDMVTILGSTASGKTEIAVNLALKLGGEVISADSRQIYRKMDLGTGKDIAGIPGQWCLMLPYHLIDIAEGWLSVQCFRVSARFSKGLSNCQGKREIFR